MTPQVKPWERGDVEPVLDLAELTRRLHRARVKFAFHDPATFNELVLRDEQTGDPIRLAPYHAEWQELLSTHTRAIIWSHFDAGKSWQISIGRVLWELGHNHNLRIGIASNTAGPDSTSSKIAGAIRSYIEESDELHEVFPDLQPGDVWRGTAFNVAGRKGSPKDFSVQAIGVLKKFQGTRFDIIILDDILDLLSTATEHQRKKITTWVESDVIGRLAQGGRVWMVGNVYHKQDALHAFARKVGWFSRKYPAIDANGESLWPEHWTPERIAQARHDMGPTEFLRKMRCEERDDESARFKEAWLETALARGNGKKPTWGLKFVPNGYQTHTGMDVAVKKHEKADLSAHSTLLLHPNETRGLLWVESGKWAGPEIVEQVRQVDRRFLSMIMVENNGAQDYILQFTTERSAANVRGFTTGSNKAHPEFGIEGLFTEFANGKWIIPNMNGELEPEIAALVNDMLTYDPHGHTGDRLMSLWLARESVRQGVEPVAWQGSLGLRRR